MAHAHVLAGLAEAEELAQRRRHVPVRRKQGYERAERQPILDHELAADRVEEERRERGRQLVDRLRESFGAVNVAVDRLDALDRFAAACGSPGPRRAAGSRAPAAAQRRQSQQALSDTTLGDVDGLLDGAGSKDGEEEQAAQDERKRDLIQRDAGRDGAFAETGGAASRSTGWIPHAPDDRMLVQPRSAGDDGRRSRARGR